MIAQLQSIPPQARRDFREKDGQGGGQSTVQECNPDLILLFWTNHLQIRVGSVNAVGLWSSQEFIEDED